MMSEEEKKDEQKTPETEKKEPSKELPPPGDDMLVVSVHYNTKTGAVGVKGPGNGVLYDEPMCFWLLDKGKDFIKGHNMAKLRPKIISPRGGMSLMPGMLKRKPS